ncbi:hypothetical protein ANN_02237 [Periplaneta americana]|uniref:Uncharacterized protein n=1 Tax=Periplaneta americana TaxID=6978 RepID=A0ABQ8TVQ6_PERAM|nr:hypothetical protein ANN_02237 [Periplaneta americana]
MSPGSSTESYPAFAHIGLRENPGKNLNQVTCPDRESNPGHLVSRPDVLTVTPQKTTIPSHTENVCTRCGSLAFRQPTRVVWIQREKLRRCRVEFPGSSVGKSADILRHHTMKRVMEDGAYSVGSRPTSHSYRVHLSTCVDFDPAFIDIYDVVQRAATRGNPRVGA